MLTGREEDELSEENTVRSSVEIPFPMSPSATSDRTPISDRQGSDVSDSRYGLVAPLVYDESDGCPRRKMKRGASSGEQAGLRKETASPLASPRVMSIPRTPASVGNTGLEYAPKLLPRKNLQGGIACRPTRSQRGTPQVVLAATPELPEEGESGAAEQRDRGAPTLATVFTGMKRKENQEAESCRENDSAGHESVVDEAEAPKLIAGLPLTPYTTSPDRWGYHSAYFTHFSVGGRPLPFAIADTGAGESILTSGLLQHIPRRAIRGVQALPAAKVKLVSAQGEPIVKLGRMRLLFKIGTRNFEHRFTVICGSKEHALLVLGNDFLAKHHARLQIQPPDIPTSLTIDDLPDGEGPLVTPLRVGRPLAAEHPISASLTSVPGDEPEKLRSCAEAAVYSPTAIRLAPWAETLVPLDAPLSMKEELRPLLVSPFRDWNDQPKHLVAHTLSPIQDGKVLVRLLNPNPTEEIHIQPMTAIAKVTAYDEQHILRNKDLPTVEEVYQELKVDDVPGLTEEHKQSFRDLIRRRLPVFSNRPGRTHVIQHHINTGNHPPVAVRARRTSPAEREIIGEHIDKLIKEDIIERSISPWSSPLMLVPKKTQEGEATTDGMRVVCDLRRVNQITEKCEQPLPNITAALEALQGSAYFTTLDLRAGFHQIELNELSKPKTAFSTPFGKFQYRRMPMGLITSPSTFEMLVDCVLRGLPGEICQLYLDDIIIHSGRDVYEHIRRLDLVLERFQAAGLTIKTSKTQLLRDALVWLGHRCSAEGIAPDPDKIKVMQELAMPRTLEQVRSMLGLFGYYRRMIPNFHRMAAPLYALTKSGVDVAAASQNEECERAVEELKTALTTAPGLAYPDFSRPFILHTDACKEGIGAVLTQKDDEGQERPIAYWGRALHAAERNYTVTEWEALAVVAAVKNWRPYLWGRKFKCVVDHSALKFMLNLRCAEGGPVGRLGRWSLQLSQYDMEIEYRPGRVHTNADAISRLVAVPNKDVTPPQGPPARIQRRPSEWSQLPALQPCSELDQSEEIEGCDMNAAITRGVVRAFAQGGAPPRNKIKEEQRKDPECKEIIDYLAEGTLPSQFKAAAALASKAANYALSEDGILTRKAQKDSSPNSTYWRIVVPPPLREAFLTIYHDQSGHLGEARSSDLLARRVWWAGCQADMTRHVRRCLACAKAKQPKLRIGELLHPEVGQRPFEVIQIDSLYMPGDEEYNHVIVMLCPLTRWVECSVEPREPDSDRMLQILLDHWILRHGCPRLVITDRGSNLVSGMCQSFYELFGIKLHAATTGHHRTVGAVERFNHTLCSMVRSCRERGESWVPYLPYLLFAYRCTVQKVTKESPYSLVYGMDARFPADIALLGPAPEDATIGPATREWFKRHCDRLHDAWITAGRRTMEGHEHRKETKDKSAHTEVAFKENDPVLLLKQPLPRAGGKLDLPWDGAYRIAEVLSNDNYRLRDLHSRRMHDVVHVSRLQPCPIPDDDEPLHADEYHVDSLLDQRMTPGGDVQYKVRWKGYPLSQASWVDAAALEHRCWDMMLAFAERRAKEAKDSGSDTAQAQQEGPGQGTSVEQPTATSEAEPTGETPTPMPVPGTVRTAKMMRGVWHYETAHEVHGARVVWRWLPSHALTAEQLTQVARLRRMARASSPPKTKPERHDHAAARIQEAWRRFNLAGGRAPSRTVNAALPRWGSPEDILPRQQENAAKCIQRAWMRAWPMLLTARGTPSKITRNRGLSSPLARVGYVRLMQHLYRRRKARPQAKLLWRPVYTLQCRNGLNLCSSATFRDQKAISDEVLAYYAQYPRILAALRRRPAVILDVCCGAGGVSEGARRLPGVNVIGLDILPQPAYARRFGTFIQGDALDTHLLQHIHRVHRIDAAWCSPPCQAYSNGCLAANTKHHRIVPQAREALQTLRVPFLLEEVMGARRAIRSYATVARGTYFGLQCERPRYIEPNGINLHMDTFLKQRADREIRPFVCLGDRRRYSRVSPFGVPDRHRCCRGNLWSVQGWSALHTTVEASAYALGLGPTRRVGMPLQELR